MVQDLLLCPVCGWPPITVGKRAWCVRPYTTWACDAFQFGWRGGRWVRTVD